MFGFVLPAREKTIVFATYIAGPIELVAGVLLMIGLFTVWAAFLSTGFMAFAHWMVYEFKGLLPLVNHGELAALYCFNFLFISAYGVGIWSIDPVRNGGK